jgi:hypothetical protein
MYFQSAPGSTGFDRLNTNIGAHHAFTPITRNAMIDCAQANPWIGKGAVHDEMQSSLLPEKRFDSVWFRLLSDTPVFSLLLVPSIVSLAILACDRRLKRIIFPLDYDKRKSENMDQPRHYR